MRSAAAWDRGGEVRPTSPGARAPSGLRRAEGTAHVELGLLYQALAPRLQRAAQRMTRDPLAAEDVVQTAFEKALRHVAGFRGEARLSTWLHRIVTNEALVWLRTERRRTRPLLHEGDGGPAEAYDPSPQMPEILQLRERVARVQDGLRRLRAAERDVLLRIFVEDQDYATIAIQTATHHGAIKTRAFRARRRLRALLASTP